MSSVEQIDGAMAAVFASRWIKQVCSSQMERHPPGTLHEASRHDNESGHRVQEWMSRGQNRQGNTLRTGSGVMTRARQRKPELGQMTQSTKPKGSPCSRNEGGLRMRAAVRSESADGLTAGLRMVLVVDCVVMNGRSRTRAGRVVLSRSVLMITPAMHYQSTRPSQQQ
jgi:hypothetical protein